MNRISNPYRGRRFSGGIQLGDDDIPFPSVDVSGPQKLLRDCPASKPTPLVHQQINGTDVWIKDERGRKGLGSFKALGAAYVIAHDARVKNTPQANKVWITASAGNHGLSLAAGARVFGARAVVYLAETVPESFAARLRDKGAQVVRSGADYEASMRAAAEAAEMNGWTLLSDSSWPGYTELPHRLMEGYLVLAAEIVAEIPMPPTHIFLQAGVGGLAAAAAACFRSVWGDEPEIIVVEPEAAPALQASIARGAPVETAGPASSMGRLDCKVPSLIALKGLARDADVFATLSDGAVEAILPDLAAAGLATSASGGAGVAAMMLCALPPQSRALCILSEGPDE